LGIHRNRVRVWYVMLLALVLTFVMALVAEDEALFAVSGCVLLVLLGMPVVWWLKAMKETTTLSS
jgi:hypothetical protein